jgi:hypothetical protein
MVRQSGQSQTILITPTSLRKIQNYKRTLRSQELYSPIDIEIRRHVTLKNVMNENIESLTAAACAVMTLVEY